MTNPPATPAHRREDSIILAPPGGVTAVSISAFLAVLTALALRLVFVHWFPATTDDSAVYQQLAYNWIDHHVYGLMSNAQVLPADLRAPGYPVFLAGVGLLFRRSIQAILLSQALLDVCTCILTAALAGALAPAGARRRVSIITLWLAATCPFLANYAAVVLTEVLVTFLATTALCCFALALREEPAQAGWDVRIGRPWNSAFEWALLGSLFTGVAALVRPEMPLLFGVAFLVCALRVWKAQGARKTILILAALGGAFVLPLVPWAARNAVSLHKLQFLAPRYATFPGEYPPVGYYAWTGTWLERFRDVYFTIWSVGEDPMSVEDLPAAAFDSPEERARIADLTAQYNNSPEMDISPEMDRQYAEIARERTRRNPFRTYVRVPFERALTIWFTPRTELLPIDGKFFPLREQWQDSHADVIVTGGFAVLGYLYVALAFGGTWLAWRAGRHGDSESGTGDRANVWGIALLAAYLLIRTVFLTTVEAPEPRYVISCYPVVLAFAAQLAICRRGREEANKSSNAS